MTSVLRPYINQKFNQMVDDGCLEYRSVPMAVVNDVIKVNISKNDYDGIKQVYNVIPPRPININAMATSIARINNLPYSEVENISRTFIAEEVAAVNRFVASNPMYLNGIEFNDPYIPEQPTNSSSGVRLEPEEIASSRGTQTFGFRGRPQASQTDTDMISTGTQMNTPLDKFGVAIQKYKKPQMGLLEGVSFILGNEPVSSGVVPFNTSMESQTEWMMSKQKGFTPVSRDYGLLGGKAETFVGGMDINKGVVRHYREGTATQTNLSKPPTNKYIEKDINRIKQTFYEDPENRQASFEGIRLGGNNRSMRAESLVGPSQSGTDIKSFFTPKKNN